MFLVQAFPSYWFSSRKKKKSFFLGCPHLPYLLLCIIRAGMEKLVRKLHVNCSWKPWTGIFAMPFQQVPRKLVLKIGLLDSCHTVVIMKRTLICLEVNVGAESTRGGILSFNVSDLGERTAALGIQVYLLLLFAAERVTDTGSGSGGEGRLDIY